MTDTFIFHTDPSHGWLEVAQDDLSRVGLTLDRISGFSYIGSDGRLYLEEDCDASLFAAAYRATTGRDLVAVERHTDRDSPIRAYRHLPQRSA